MKALTVRQPWAWAIAHGHKTIENRTWLTRDYGRLAIHAATKWDGYAAHQLVTDLANVHMSEVRVTDKHMGAVVAVANLADVCTVREGCDCGPWAIPGQFHWRLANVRLLPEPVPCKGRLGLWDLPPAVEIAVLDQLQGVAR